MCRYLIIKYVLLLSLTFASCTLFSQGFNGGVIAGLSTSEISGDFLNGPSKAGLYLGFFTNRYFSSSSSMQMEIDYVQKGSRKVPDSADITDYKLRLHYIELHFYYKYDIQRFTFEAGPSLGYLADSYEETDGWIIDDPFNHLDFSINIGAYYAINDNLRFNIRYSNTAFIPVRDNPSGHTPTLRRGQYNEVLSFTIHYTFFHSRK